MKKLQLKGTILAPDKVYFHDSEVRRRRYYKKAHRDAREKKAAQYIADASERSEVTITDVREFRLFRDLRGIDDCRAIYDISYSNKNATFNYPETFRSP